ncbi:MAG: hypothetical protein ABS58_01205 [Mesorhizobium sp. SCN 65-20]|nr:MAG: hypothetical protein ABS58_01205 [Mesorhizobium sp. SCN 65-20]
MLRTHVPHRIVGTGTALPVEPEARSPRLVKGQTEPFMFTRLFFVTGVLLGGLALASLLSS